MTAGFAWKHEFLATVLFEAPRITETEMRHWAVVLGLGADDALCASLFR